MRAPRTRTALPLLLWLTLNGCSPEPRFVTWEPLDLEGILAGLEQPTGSLDPEHLETIVAAVNEIADDLLLLRDMLEWSYGQIGPEETPTPRLLAATGGREPSGRGTAVYITLACPGPSLSWPESEFRHGHVRIDSARFDLDDAVGYLLEGDALFRFRDCGLGRRVVTGQAPAYWDSSTEILALDIDLLFAPEDGSTASSHRLLLQLLLDSERMSVLLGDPEDGTYRLTLRADAGDSAALAGADREITCGLVDRQLKCEL